MNIDNQPPNGIRESDEKGINKSRRLLTKVGLGAPVLLSLSNKPAWATSATCSISGQLSGNLSPGAAASQTCDQTHPYGCSATFWLSSSGLNTWPGGNVTKNTKFNSHPVFSNRTVYTGVTSRSGKITSWNYNPTLLQVMQANSLGSAGCKPGKGGNDPNLWADCFDAIAAYLNASTASYAYPFSIADIQSAYNSSNVATIRSFHQTIDDPNNARLWLIANGY
ncbi:MAG: hypothetical protein WC782_12560 [Methylococcaceae bacterium]|jgi:hypothetical protein